MTVVVATDDDDERCFIAFPRRAENAAGGWEWEEVDVCESPIEGFGLATAECESLNWSSLGSYRVYLPLIGRETELGSTLESQLCVRVLQGDL